MSHRRKYKSRPKLSSKSAVPLHHVPQVQSQRVYYSKPSNDTGIFASTSKQYEYSPDDARLPLTVDNYKKKFSSLVQLEKEEHARLLSQHCDGEYELRSVSSDDVESTWVGSVFHIHGLEPEQILYASQACCDVLIKCLGGDIKASIIFHHCHYDNENEVLCVVVNKRDLPKLKDYLDHNGCGTFIISFAVNHSYFNCLMTSIDRIRVDVIKRIMPTADDFEEGLDLSPIPKSSFPSNQLDEHQFRALQTMVFSRSTVPVIVPGPFGSGKTRLLSVASEHCITRAKTQGSIVRVLLCCHHQSSADIFMRDYFTGMLKDSKNPWDADVVLMISQEHKKGMFMPNVVDYDTFQGQKEEYFFKRYLVIVTTSLTALRMSEFMHPGFFTHILIDEGAQAREPECIAPLSMADRYTRIIIVGDSKQVGPELLVLGKEPQDHGLGESLLTRLQKRYMSIGEKASSYCVTLLRNYRCVADILDLPSTLFYESKLVPCARAMNIAERYPLKFVCCKEVAGGYESQHEAEIIVEELCNLVCGSNALPSNVQICIMHTSQTQGSLIRKLLSKKLSNTQMRNVNFLSTCQMQGQEFDVLILSTVEKLTNDLKPFDPLKSICHPAVFNTAITRVRSLVIAVGCPSTLIASESAIGASKVKCWKEYIDRCKAHKTYYENVTDSVRGFKIKNIETASLKKKAVGVSAKLPSVRNTVSSKQTRKPRKYFKKLSSQQPLVKPLPTPVTLTFKSTASKELNPASLRQNVGSEKPNGLSTHQQPIAKHWINPVNKVDGYYIQQNERTKANNTQRINEGSRTCTRAVKRTAKPKAVVIEGDYSEQFPSIEDSKNVSEKAIKIMTVTEKVSVIGQKFKHTHQPLDQKLLEQELTRSNYREKFHQLLCREEDEHSKLLEERCDGLYQFYVCQKSDFEKYFRNVEEYHIQFGYITADHLDEDKLAYAKQASEGGVIVEFSDATGRRIALELEMVGSVPFSKHHDQVKILLGFDESNVGFVRKDSGIVSIFAKVTFILKYSYFDRLHMGLNALSDDVIDKLMPENLTEFSLLLSDKVPTPLINCVREYVNCNDQFQNPQMFALRTITAADPSKAPILITGSFGTGKTRLLARAAYQILYNDRNAKVLVCAHHQQSIDSFVEKYFGPMVENGWLCGTLVRLALPKKADDDDSFKKEYRFEKFYKTSVEVRNLASEELQLVLATYSSAHHLKFLGKGHFTHFLLDEGAQCREPETIIPLSLANSNTTIVIAGDHKQVGPSVLVLGEDARVSGLKLSLLERLHRLYHKPELSETSEKHCVTLLTNFRSHHALLSLPSYLFYDSALVTAAEASRIELHPDAPYPLKFVCSSLDVTEETRSVNDSEVTHILDQVKKYIHNWPKEWGCLSGKDPKLCIMATTPNQRSAFNRSIQLNEEYKEIKDIKCEVLTVYEIQGREFQAVFLSTAEPIDEFGRPKNPSKSPCGQFVFNTAITRAKSLVYVLVTHSY